MAEPDEAENGPDNVVHVLSWHRKPKPNDVPPPPDPAAEVKAAYEQSIRAAQIYNDQATQSSSYAPTRPPPVEAHYKISLVGTSSRASPASDPIQPKEPTKPVETAIPPLEFEYGPSSSPPPPPSRKLDPNVPEQKIVTEPRPNRPNVHEAAAAVGMHPLTYACQFKDPEEFGRLMDEIDAENEADLARSIANGELGVAKIRAAKEAAERERLDPRRPAANGFMFLMGAAFCGFMSIMQPINSGIFVIFAVGLTIGALINFSLWADLSARK